MQRLIASFALLVVVLAPSGCVNPKKVVAPTVVLQNVRIHESKGFVQRLQVDLLVTNPNDFDIPLTGMEFQMELNGAPFAQGLANKPVTIPRLGEAIVPVKVSIPVLLIMRQIKAVGRTGKLAYHLTGTVYLDHLILPEVAFERKGNLDLPNDKNGRRFRAVES